MEKKSGNCPLSNPKEVVRLSELSPYERFKKQIEDVLRTEPKGFTWTEIKDKLGLTQKVPNNKWVRQMEKDIGLQRVKENRGTVWRLR